MTTAAPGSRLNLVVFNRIRLATPTANFVNTLNTCAALARLGANVTIYGDLTGGTPHEVLKAVGVEPMDNLALRHSTWGYRAGAAALAAPALLRRDPSRTNVALFSEVRAYAPVLIRAARRRSWLIAFEAHNAAGMMAREAARQAAGGSQEAEDRARSQEAIEREILTGSDMVVVPQRRTLEAIRPLVREGTPLVLLPNGTRLMPPAAMEKKDIDVLYAGSLSAWKGVGTIIQAMAHLAPYRLTVLGGRVEAERDTLKKMASDLGCADRISFVPPVPPAQVWSYYARARVGVVPLAATFLEAREYTCPVKLMEMMGAGLAIATARLPSVEEIVRDGVEVAMAPSDDPAAWASTIRRLLEDTDFAARLAAAGRSKAEAFSYERRARTFLETVEAAEHIERA